MESRCGDLITQNVHIKFVFGAAEWQLAYSTLMYGNKCVAKLDFATKSRGEALTRCKLSRLEAGVH